MPKAQLEMTIRGRQHNIIEGDVELHRDLGPLEQASEFDPAPFVVRIFLDALSSDVLRIETQSRG